MIFRREFSRNLKSLIIWSIALGVIILLMLSMYSQFAARQESLNELLQAYPESLKKVFSMDKLDLSTLIGYYGVEIYLMITLGGGIYAAMLASNMMVKEENEKTIEFLLSKPISRAQIVTQKLSAVIANILILNSGCVVFSFLGFQFAQDPNIPMRTFLLLMIGAFMLHMTFAMTSFLLSSLMRKGRNVLAASLGIVLGCYFLNIISGISEQMGFLKYFSPFKYVDAGSIISDNAIELIYVCIMAVVIILSVGLTYVLYQKKDIAV